MYHSLFSLIILITVSASSFAADGYTIFQAILDNDVKKVEQLIESDPKILNQSGFGMGTPLHTAVSSGNHTIAELLVSFGTDVNSMGDVLKLTPLDIAVQISDTQLVQFLVNAGADINLQNTKGQSPLMHAIAKKNTPLIKILINLGADVNSKDQFGRNSLAYAISTKSLNIVDELIQSHTEIPDADVIAKAGTCIACHIPEDNSEGNKLRPIINGLSEDYIQKQLNDFASDSRNSNIPMRNSATRKQIHIIGQRFAKELATYMTNLPVTRYSTASDNIDNGHFLFQNAKYTTDSINCASCHGANAEGNNENGSPRLAGQEVSYLIQELTEFRDGTRKNDINSQMRIIASELSDADIKALSAYLSGLR